MHYSDNLQLIKRLSATPVLPAQGEASHGAEAQDPQASLQANKATFFFRMVCNLVNTSKIVLTCSEGT
jgi:hypothetical protein